MTRDHYPWETDAFRSYAVWIASKREEAIRAGQIEPRTHIEQRWAAEGPRPVPQLEAATNPATDAGEQA